MVLELLRVFPGLRCDRHELEAEVRAWVLRRWSASAAARRVSLQGCRVVSRR